MLADSLRKSILQAAIQGRLTQREPNDGNARDLLKEIQAERSKLISEGKIRRANSLPPVSDDEIPFDIPDKWVWVRLGEIGSTHIGLTYKPSDVKEEGITVLRSSNIQDGQICLNDVVKVKCDIPDTKMCQVNDLLICARNGSKKLVGKAAIIQQEGFSFGAFMAVFRTPFYAYTYYYLLSPLFRDDLEKVGTTTINQITHANLNMRMFPLPPLAEQHRIVARLEELLPLIDSLAAYERELDAIEHEFLDAIRKSILQAAIQGRLTQREPNDVDARDLLKDIQAEKARLISEGKIRRANPLPPINDDEIPFDIPDNWCWVRLGEIVLQHLGGGTPDKSNPNYWNGNIPWASVKDLRGDVLDKTQDYITEEGLNHSSANLIPAGNLIICMRMALGKIVTNKIDVAINQDLRAFFFSNKIERIYFLYFFKTLKIIGKGATVQGVSLSEVLNYYVPLPPLAEQRRIVARLDELLKLVDELG